MSAAACLLEDDIADLDVFDRMTGNASDNQWELRRAGTGDVVDHNALQAADRDIFRATHPPPQPQEQRRAQAIAHGDIADGYVFHDGAIDGFERQSPAFVENAIADGDILETAIGFRAALDTAEQLGISIAL